MKSKTKKTLRKFYENFFNSKISVCSNLAPCNIAVDQFKKKVKKLTKAADMIYMMLLNFSHLFNRFDKLPNKKKN